LQEVLFQKRPTAVVMAVIKKVYYDRGKGIARGN
jgi:hypothetical protein